MPRSDRLLRLLHAMRTLPAPITAARLATETEISPRSLYRDIDALRSAGARIEGERGVGYRLVEDPALPPQTLDRDEIEVLALAVAEIRAWADPTLTKAAASLLAKITATLPDASQRQLLHAIASVFHPEPRYPGTIDLSPIRDACWREQAVSIRYQDADATPTDRTILPLALIYGETCVTILAWCCLREDFRMFRSDRLTEIRAEGKSFRPRRVQLLRDYIDRLQTRRAARTAPA